ncbi:MAG: hypothetical protein LUH15_01275 [Tannerellaceae bacterium]|nr:hypothetical protein [Tannerellaceae bacterium]
MKWQASPSIFLKKYRRCRLFANGPYRVYNNRLKGGTLNVWEKEYNDAITGEVWEYPEFKGYYSLFYGMKLLSPTPFEVYSASEDLFLHLFTPTIQQQYDPEKTIRSPTTRTATFHLWMRSPR